MRHRKPKYRLKSKLRLVALCLFMMLIGAGGYLWAGGYLPFELPGSSIIDMVNNDEPGEKDVYEGRKNVLLLGMDARKGETLARTDTIMLASIDTEKNQLAVLSIPRDTRVQIPGHGWDKINGATLYGGPELAMRTVSGLLGVPVQDYVLTNYDGFKEIIDALGGVTIDVEKRMYHHDPQDGGIYTIDLKPGVQRLDGEKSLQYVRYRGYALGDIDRAEHQQRFLAALTKEVLQAETVLKLPKLVSKLGDAVSTNVRFAEMVKLANTARKMKEANIVTQTLPGTFLDYHGASYWSVDPDQARLAVARLLDGERVGQVVQGSTVVASSESKPARNTRSGNSAAPGKVVPGGMEEDGGQDSGTEGAGEDKDNQNPEEKPPEEDNGNPSNPKPGKKTGDGAKTGTGTVIIIPENQERQTGQGSAGQSQTSTGQASTGTITITPSQSGIVPGGIAPAPEV